MYTACTLARTLALMHTHTHIHTHALHTLRLALLMLCSTFLPQAVRTRFQLHRHITPDYYGFRDEEDGLLAAVEPAAEERLLAAVRWHAHKIHI
jgi:Isy1-like splicing family